MKFYFCEACGKRVTQDDIAAGEGKDKKLRGVYCVQCAQGVTTMDNLPVSNEEARDLLQKETPTQKQDQPGVKRDSRSGLKPGRKPSRHSSKRITETPQARTSSPIVIGAVAGGIALLLLALFLASGNRQAPKGKENTVGKTQPAHIDPKERPPSTEAVATVDESPKGSPEPSPSDTPEPPTTPAPEEPPNVAAPATAPEKKTEPEVDTEPTKEATGEAKADAKKPVEPAKPAGPPPPPKPSQKPYQLSLEQELAGVAEALGRGSFDDAEKRLQKQPATSLGDWAFMRGPLSDAVKWLKERAALRRKALDALVGSRIRVKTPDLRVSGKVTKVDGETLTIQRIFRINNQERLGTVSTVPFSALPADQQKKLLKLPEPAQDAELLGAALSLFSKNRLKGAHGQVARIKDPKPRAAMEWFLEIRAWRARESAAQAEWEKLSSASREANTSEAARPVWKGMKAYEETFRGTQEHWRTLKERKALTVKLQVLSEGLEAIVRRAFGDGVVKFDPITRKLNLHLAFKNKSHFDMLERTVVSGLSGSGDGGRQIHRGTKPGVFFTRAFATDELDLTLRCRSHNLYVPEWHKGIWLGIPRDPKNATRDRYGDGEGIQVLWNPSGNYTVLSAGPNAKRVLKKNRIKSSLIMTVRVRLKENRLNVFQKLAGEASEVQVLTCDVSEVSRSAGIGFGWKGKTNNPLIFYELHVTGQLDEAWVSAAIAKRIRDAQNKE